MDTVQQDCKYIIVVFDDEGIINPCYQNVYFDSANKVAEFILKSDDLMFIRSQEELDYKVVEIDKSE